LSNEALKDDHWKQLSKICHLDGEVLDPKFETVESLNQRNLNKYIEEIEALSHRA
jgi:hypothetical protein